MTKSNHKLSSINQTKELCAAPSIKINMYSSKSIKISPIKLMRKTPPKIMIKSSKKKIIEPQSFINPLLTQEQMLFKFCMEYYLKILNEKLPYEINLQ